MSAPLAFPDLTFRQDYFDDPAGWKAIGDLLKTVFGVDIGPLDALGGHDRSNMPSAYFDAGGRCVANFAAFSMPLVIDGRRVRAAAWQSGAVLPDYRGRGLFRELIRITLERCEQAGFEVIVLYTDKPALYEPYGFVTFREQSFTGPAPAAGNAFATARRLSVENPVDLALLRETLARRTPVSNRIAVCDQSLMFLLNAYLLEDVTLSWLEAEQAVIAWRQPQADRFELLDIVAADIPALDTIIAGLGLAPTIVTVQFPPDRLGWEETASAVDGDLVFMMRGPQALMPQAPFRLSPMAEF
ncbi:GNAT family N-acetyltransferase [Rhizobium sp. YJ-22]|uniref:GNAT family N-acetyltransferase n=1 Tax=Rhizobium sp. YJ-22 TaxID=3037556 RepID=UPI00241278A1|nr:GNAT family N-acetyltransferase [Rhizobium sp. YJ-22]MDG3577824.1 GNAT family N-acetyltransferase [Rhizobium sp. YJ-22]